MSYRCPLCLQDLTPGSQIVRYCTEHSNIPDRTIIFTEEELDDDRLSENLFCPEEGCNAHNAIGVPKGIFLSHVGCEATNPFWDEKQNSVIIPNDPDEDEGYRLQKKSLIGGREFPVTLRHWEIGMLRTIKHDPSHRYMWFPLMLFLALADKRKEKKLSSVVTLIGDKDVGKTVLAMQAMEEQGYIPKGNKTRSIEVADFLYSRLAKGRTPIQNHWFESIFLRYLHRRNLSSHFRPFGTVRVPGDLKAVFIQPTSNIGSMTGARDLASRNGHRGGVKTLNPLKLAERVFNLSKDSIIYYMRAFIGKEGAPVGEDRQFRYTLLLYDSAGEMINDAGSYLGRITHCSDKIAVLVSAPELLGLTVRERSIQVAHERFRDLLRMRLNKRVCLVVTQMDRIKGEVEKDWDVIERVAEDLDKDHDQDARRLVMDWLSKQNTYSKEEFSRDIKYFERIFFLWTTNLPKQHGSPIVIGGSTDAFDKLEKLEELGKEDMEELSDKQPESYGLAKFVCWCLDINWSDINHG